jgi:hypothetical protein
MKIRIKKNTWLKTLDVGWGNGYCYLEDTHPLYGVHYDVINEQVSVHGGLTYSEKEGGFWVVGFDTAHYQDTSENWTKARVITETKHLRNQLIQLGLHPN